MKHLRKTKFIFTSLLATVGLAIFLTSCATQVGITGDSGPIVQNVGFTYYPNGVAQTDCCFTQYFACFKMTCTNGANTNYPGFTPPTNVTSCVFTCLTTNLGPGIQWALLATDRTLFTHPGCATNSYSVSFNASYLDTNQQSKVAPSLYSFNLYINNQTNSATNLVSPICLQVNWNTN